SGDGSQNLLRADDGTVVGEIDVESGVHLLVGVVRGRVFHDRNLVAEFSRKANGCFDAGMRDQSDDDELMDAVVVELQIQIRIGEAAGTPVLRGDNLARFRLEFRAISPPHVPYSKLLLFNAAF